MRPLHAVLVASIASGLVSAGVFAAAVPISWMIIIGDTSDVAHDAARAGAVGAALGLVMGGIIAAACIAAHAKWIATVISGIVNALVYGVVTAIGRFIYFVSEGYTGPNGLGISIVLAAATGVAALFGAIIGGVVARATGHGARWA